MSPRPYRPPVLGSIHSEVVCGPPTRLSFARPDSGVQSRLSRVSSLSTVLVASPDARSDVAGRSLLNSLASHLLRPAAKATDQPGVTECPKLPPGPPSRTRGCH